MSADAPIDFFPDWPITKLGEIALKIGSGATPRGGEETYLPVRARFALVRSQNVFDRRFDVAGLAFISDEQASRLQGAALQPGDLLLNITGDGVTFSRSCAVPREILPACVNQHVAIIRVDPAVADSDFVLAFLTHPQIKPYIESFNAGGSRRAITKGHIESFRLALPPLPEQRAIAHILGTLDDKIELNRQMNQTLEQIAATLFKSWFVDFDPVRAKAEGRQPDGMDAETAMLFPDRLVASEIGEIPEGWAARQLGDVCSELRRGVSPKYVDTGGVQVLNQRCIRDHMLDMSKARRHDDTARPVEGRLLKVGDVLVNSTGVGTLGRVAQILSLKEPTIADSHVTVIRANLETVSITYLGLLLVDREEEIEAMGEGSTGQTELARSRLISLPVVTPPRQLLAEADKTLMPLFQRMQVAQEESGTLAALRDSLLPRLLSGEIRMPIDVLDDEGIPMQSASHDLLAQSHF